MRISDWSSDVCSSDLHAAGNAAAAVAAGVALVIVGTGMDDERRAIGIEQPAVAFETRTDEVQRRAADLVGFDHEIGQVAMMRAHRIFAAMLRAGRVPVRARAREVGRRSEEHTSELQSLMRISYAV